MSDDLPTAIEVTGLRIHPVKSTAIRGVQSAQVTRAGLIGDREWMVVDGGGDLVSARELPALFAIVADNRGTGVQHDLQLTAPGMHPMVVSYPENGATQVRMFSDPPLTARSAGSDVDDWLQQAIGRADLHLVWCHDPAARRLDPEYSRPGDYTAFADGFPLTLVTDPSVRRLQEWVDETTSERGEEPVRIPAARFRANIEVSGPIAAFEEDTWSRIRIGAVEFRVPVPSARCVMTTIDERLHKGKEPIRTMARHRRWDGRTWFAPNLIPDGEGTICVGDVLEVLERAPRRNRTTRDR